MVEPSFDRSSVFGIRYRCGNHMLTGKQDTLLIVPQPH
jgi:hypothetical protein